MGKICIIDDQYSNFLQKHEEILFDIIDRYIPNMSNDAKKYAVNARKVGARGFGHLSANPNSDENRAFIQNIDKTFEQSGMNDFLKRLV